MVDVTFSVSVSPLFSLPLPGLVTSSFVSSSSPLSSCLCLVCHIFPFSSVISSPFSLTFFSPWFYLHCPSFCFFFIPPRFGLVCFFLFFDSFFMEEPSALSEKVRAGKQGQTTLAVLSILSSFAVKKAGNTALLIRDRLLTVFVS